MEVCYSQTLHKQHNQKEECSMRKIAVFFALVACMFLMAVPGQAATKTITITFDEGPLGIVGEFYADYGVHFAPPAGAPGDDAEIVAGGTWGITGNNGPRFLGCDGILGQYGKSSGFVFELDMTFDSFAFDFTTGTGTTTTNKLTVMPFSGGSPDFMNIKSVALPGVNQWVTVDMSAAAPFEALIIYVATDDTTDAYLGFDNVVIGGIPCNAPVADFSADPVSGIAPLTVSFTDLSTGASSWSWDFGDGDTSSAQNPTHTYDSPGTYNVCLEVSNDCGTHTACMDIVVDPEPCDLPTACFTADPTSGDAPLTVTFADCSEDADSWLWDFGDGITSIEQNPTHTYSIASNDAYTVCLTVENECGTDQVCAEITVIKPGAPPEAAFSADPTSGYAPLTVIFTDESTGNPTGWSWNFGDGETSSDQNPVHTYNDPGTYTVTLSVVNDYGFSEADDVITVREQGPGPAVHVNNMYVWKQVWFGWSSYCRGKAWVQVVDEAGAPVVNATVSGEWTGDVYTQCSFQTNRYGWGMCASDWTACGQASTQCEADLTFCVTDIVKDGSTYDPGANVDTCGTAE